MSRKQETFESEERNKCIGNTKDISRKHESCYSVRESAHINNWARPLFIPALCSVSVCLSTPAHKQIMQYHAYVMERRLTYSTVLNIITYMHCNNFMCIATSILGTDILTLAGSPENERSALRVALSNFSRRRKPVEAESYLRIAPFGEPQVFLSPSLIFCTSVGVTVGCVHRSESERHHDAASV